MKTLDHFNSRRVLDWFAVSVLLVLAAGCIYVHESNSGYTNDDLEGTAGRTVSGEIPADLKSLEIENHSGAIRVVAAEDTSAQWTWNLKVQARTDAIAQQWADKIECSAVRDGERLRVVVSIPDFSGPHSIQSDLELRVPKSLAVSSRNHFGATTISGL